MDEDVIRAKYRAAISRAQAQWSGEPSRYGRDDCMLAIANIDINVLGVDTAMGFRGRYRSARGALKVMGPGGVLATARKVARRFHWRSIKRGQWALAKDGDRGVALTGAGLTCVIRYRGFWIARFDRGDQLATDSQMIAAWSLF